MNISTLLKIGENLTENSTFGERMSVGLQVVAIGMGVVFGVLILLIGILQIFKLFSGDNKQVKPKAEAPVQTSTAAPSSTVSATANEEEKIVAIASAAIAASRGKSEVDFTVLSIAPIGSAPVASPASVAAPASAAPAPVATAPAAPVAEPVAKTEPVVAGEGEKVSAPLPGNILDVKVSAGMNVKQGDILCILEAMKMENEIVAPKDGNIVTVAATKGSSVNTGDLLFVIG